MSLSLRTPAISSSGISAQLIRLLPPVGCPGHPIWVPPNEVQRWEQLGFGRAPIPAADLELSWQPAGQESGGLIPIELLLNPRHTPHNAVTVDWGDGVSETLPWPVGGDGNGRLRHSYTSRNGFCSGEPGGLPDLAARGHATPRWRRRWNSAWLCAALDPWCWPKWHCLRREHNPTVEPDAMEWWNQCWWCAS